MHICVKKKGAEGVHKLGAFEHNYLSKESEEVVVQERGVWEHICENNGGRGRGEGGVG